MTNLIINTITKKTSSSGKSYHQIETSEGKMSIWDIELAKEVEEKYLGKPIDAGIQQKGNYKNLIGISGFIDAAKMNSSDAIGESAKQKRKSEQMRCAVDICLSRGTTSNEEILSQFEWQMKAIGEQ